MVNLCSYEGMQFAVGLYKTHAILREKKIPLDGIMQDVSFIIRYIHYASDTI